MQRPLALCLALAFSAVTAGCFEDGAPASGAGASVCEDVDGSATASGNTPRLHAFTGTPATAAARLADAVGDPLANEAPDATRSTADNLRWNTTSGGDVAVHLDGDVLTQVSWSGSPEDAPTTEAESRAFLDRVLDALGVPEDARADPVDTGDRGLELWFRQQYHGAPVGRTGGHFSAGAFSMLTLGPYHDFSNVNARVDDAAAEEVARAYARCRLDAMGMTEDEGHAFLERGHVTYAVVDESLSRAFTFRYAEPGEPSHCGLVFTAHVDVETRAALGGGIPPCD